MINYKDSAASYINFYVDEKEESESDLKDLFFDIDLSSNISENLKIYDRKKSKLNLNDSISNLYSVALSYTRSYKW